MSIGDKVIISAPIGGTAEALGGGKFSNGAVTGAFVYLLNHANHERAKAQEKKASYIMKAYAAYLHTMPGILQGAVAVYGDIGAMLVGAERDFGGVFILAGSDAGTFYGYDELAGGISTDGSVGGEIGRYDIYGINPQDFKADFLKGEYFKGWLSVGQGIIAGLSMAVSFPIKGITLVATSIQMGIGATPFVVPFSGGYNKGIFNLWEK